MDKPNPSSYLEDEFARKLIEHPRPSALAEIKHYDADGDFIEFRSKRGTYNAERVSSVLTVYYGRESGALIGSRIKGVRYLLQKYPALLIEAKDGRVKLSHLIIAASGENRAEGTELLVLKYEKVYRDLMDISKEQDIDSRDMVLALS